MKKTIQAPATNWRSTDADLARCVAADSQWQIDHSGVVYDNSGRRLTKSLAELEDIMRALEWFVPVGVTSNGIHWRAVPNSAKERANKVRKVKKTPPGKSAIIAILVLAGLLVPAIIVAVNQAWPPEVTNIAAGGLTIVGLLVLFVADLVQLWIHEDNAANASGPRKVWDRLMIGGHGLVIVGASLFFVNYLVAGLQS